MTVLAGWLAPSFRGDPGLGFEVIDTTELGPATAQTVQALARALAEAKSGLDVVAALAERRGWNVAAARITRSKNEPLSKGDFGEVLAFHHLGEFEHVVTPILKLRAQTDPEQSLHGTDVVGFEMSSPSEIETLILVEAKFRTEVDLAVGTDARSGLIDDLKDGFADTIAFTAEQLNSLNRPMYDAFMDYLEKPKASERYGIVIVHEESKWDERVIERINETCSDGLLNPLRVCILLVEGLATLTDQVYAAITPEALA